MKRYFSITIISLILLCACFAVQPVSELSMTKYNIEHLDDATPVVVQALTECKTRGIKKLVFPKGVYHFYPTFAPDKYCAITNNDNGLKRTAFPLIGFDDFEIEGNGAEFIFHGKMVPFIIEESSDISIKNLRTSLMC